MSNPIVTKEIIRRYDVTGPRYTSYPTAPEWTRAVNATIYKEKLQLFDQSQKTLSLYIHLPFCQSLCYFCGCNVVIREQKEKYANEYLEALASEFGLIASTVKGKPTIRQLHWGGGTPTFLSEAQIDHLFSLIQKHFTVDLTGEIAIEVDPRTIDFSKLKKLRQLGFNRISMGVQDFNETVQHRIHRYQPLRIVEQTHQWCRELQFQSVNYDLIYGLPLQTLESFRETIDQVVQLKPDRIALYSFAYLPWLKKHHTKFNENDLPSNDVKLDIFLHSREKLLASGYQAIAMDHFALTSDEMAIAFNQKRLYRNFMGYTVKPADEFIGAGVSSIGFLEKTFIQNHKTLPEYYAAIRQGQLPIERGKVLTLDDQIRQWTINQLMCHFGVKKDEFFFKFEIPFDLYFKEEASAIFKLCQEGLCVNFSDALTVTEIGQIFVRNICMEFDWYLRQKTAHKQFSRTV